MKTYKYKNYWKAALLLIAIAIGVISLAYTNKLVKQMKAEERKSMEIWAQATSFFANSSDEGQNLNLPMSIITKNTNIPVILCGNDGNIISKVNLKPNKENNEKYLEKLIQKMNEEHEPIVINLPGGEKNIIYYDDSTILKQLAIYPYVQLTVISLFFIVAYFAFNSSRKAEQNQVWVGMSKETAHQLGTPISSLMAWLEILENSGENLEYVTEMQKDILRLKTITERFSKIGSAPELPLTDLKKTLESGLKYLQNRISDKVQFEINYNDIKELILPLSNALFNWVIENLVKNAVDAMNGEGKISVRLTDNEKEAIITIKDTGKGIPKTKQKTIFKPGYTSKDRGWGLGLSLAHRIIEQYHKGKIWVEESEINQGTTFKILIPK